MQELRRRVRAACPDARALPRLRRSLSALRAGLPATRGRHQIGERPIRWVLGASPLVVIAGLVFDRANVLATRHVTDAELEWAGTGGSRTTGPGAPYIQVGPASTTAPPKPQPASRHPNGFENPNMPALRDQCTNRSGSRRATAQGKRYVRPGRPRSLLYLPCAQRARCSFTRLLETGGQLGLVEMPVVVGPASHAAVDPPGHFVLRFA